MKLVPALCFCFLLFCGSIGFAQTTHQLLDSAKFYQGNDAQKVVTFSLLAYHKAEEEHDEPSLAKGAYLAGYGNYLFGNADEALRWWLISEKKYMALRDTSGIAAVYNELCVLYVKQKKFSAADEVSATSIRLSSRIHDIEKLANAYNNRGLMYLDQHLNDSAIRSFRQSYFYYRTSNNTMGMAYALDYLASALADEGRLDESLKYLLISRDLRTHINDKLGEAYVLDNIGELFLQLNKPAASINYFLQSRDSAKQMHLADLIANTYLMEGSAYKKLGNYEKAFTALEMYQKLHDELLNDKRIKAIDELQTKYETEKKEQKNILLTQENKVQALKLSRRNVALMASLMVILLIIGISYLLYNRYRLRQQARMSEELLKQQQIRTKAIMNAEESERQRLARELHDGVAQTLAAARRKIHALPSNTAYDTATAESVQLLDESIKEVRQLSHSMMPPSMRNKNLVQALDELALRTRQTTNINVHTDWVNANDLELEKTQTLMLYRVVQEMIANSIKHAQAKNINIELVNHEAELTLMVYDDGNGFDKIITMNTGGGLGLKNIESRIAFIGGSLELDTQPGKGTTFIIDLPLK